MNPSFVLLFLFSLSVLMVDTVRGVLYNESEDNTQRADEVVYQNGYMFLIKRESRNPMFKNCNETKMDDRGNNEVWLSVERADEEYEEHSDFIRRVRKHPTLNHIGNEKTLFSLLTSYSTIPPMAEKCLSIQGSALLSI